jgi:hypothetical protein
MSTSGFASTMKHPFDAEGRFSCRLEPNPSAHQRSPLPRSSKKHFTSEMQPTIDCVFTSPVCTPSRRAVTLPGRAGRVRRDGRKREMAEVQKSPLGEGEGGEVMDGREKSRWRGSAAIAQAFLHWSVKR